MCVSLEVILCQSQLPDNILKTELPSSQFDESMRIGMKLYISPVASTNVWIYPW